MLKGLCSGAVNTALALMFGAKLAPVATLAAIGLVGILGYGVSLVLFVLALRHLGTARTGAVISVLFLREPITAGLAIAGFLMAAGVWLHLTERHGHAHHHEPLEHEHRHTHDEHHQHAHAPNDPPGEPHSHPHRHEELAHSHPHFPDLHHRHGH